MKSKTALARKLRQHSTGAEQRMWAVLRNRQVEGFKFYRQFPIGPYIADFCCRSLRLVVEIDGGSHIGKEVEDAQREKNLQALGYEVNRFTNDQVMKDIDQVVEAIKVVIFERVNQKKG